MFTFSRMHKILSPLPTIIKYWLITHYITMQCYTGNQREPLYNVPTRIATEHYIHVLIKLSENVPSLLETQCYVHVPCRMT